jgi:hypothetical protein
MWQMALFSNTSKLGYFGLWNRKNKGLFILITLENIKTA